jgi:hypothetical protein
VVGAAGLDDAKGDEREVDRVGEVCEGERSRAEESRTG